MTYQTELHMFRNVIAVVVGMFVGMATNMAIVVMNMAIYPMPEGVDFNNTAGLTEYIDNLPFLALLIVLVAHLSQAFVGGWVAARISANRLVTVALIVGVLSLAGGIYNMTSMPLPSWMLIEMPLYLVAAWSAAKLEQKRRHYGDTEVAGDSSSTGSMSRYF